jgi:uncharacterized C2H2 Zn-finger protein
MLIFIVCLYVKDHLNNHLKVHERSKVRLECPLCGCIFAKKWTYEKHMALHERDVLQNDQMLDLKDLTGSNDSDDDRKEDSYPLSRHQDSQAETADQPYLSCVPVIKKSLPASQKPSHPCDVCGKVFSASKDLRRHLQTHLGVKSNLCPFCPKKFTRKDHVRRHVMTVHAQSKADPAFNDDINCLELSLPGRSDSRP